VIVGLEEPEREHGVAQASAGVEARAEPESDVLRRDGQADLADFDQGTNARPQAVFQLPQPAPDEDSIFFHQRNDVSHRTERDKIEIIAEIDPPLPLRELKQPVANLEDESHARKIIEPAVALRIDQCMSGR
jgi:hypothetical protein